MPLFLLQEHLKDVHGRARFICDVCNKDYAMQRQLAAHLIRIHDINGNELREKMLKAIQSQDRRAKQQQSDETVATMDTGGEMLTGATKKQTEENMQILHVKEISEDGTIVLENNSGQAIESKDFEMATLSVEEEQLPLVLVSSPE